MPPCDLCMPSKLDLRMQMAAWHSALSQQFRSKSPFSHHTRRHRTHRLWATNKDGVVSRQQRRCNVRSLAEERTKEGDRKGIVWGKGVESRVDLGGRRKIKKNT